MSPQTKASFAHNIMDELRALPPNVTAAIRARTGPAWTHIEQALPVMWLDEETYNALTEATRAELGDEAFQALFRKVGRRLIKTPLFQAALEAMIRISGLSPHSLLKFAPRGRESIVRDSGELTYTCVDERCAHLTMRDFPASTYRTGTTALLVGSTLLGLVDVANHAGTASLSLRDVDLERGRTTFVLRW